VLANTTGEGLRWRAGGAVARLRLAGTPPNQAAPPDAAEAGYLEDVGRRTGRDDEAAANGIPAATALRSGGG
jgi:hypothetical protein